MKRYYIIEACGPIVGLPHCDGGTWRPLAGPFFSREKAALTLASLRDSLYTTTKTRIVESHEVAACSA